METRTPNSIREDLIEGHRSEALRRLLTEYEQRTEITFFWLTKKLRLLHNAIDRQIFFNYFFRDQFLRRPDEMKAIEEGVLGYISGLLFENQENLLGLVHTDSLTRLLNRQGYEANIIKHIARHKRIKREGSADEAVMVFIDVNGFKELNDKEGHPFGDLALTLVAETITECTRTTDLKARFGGDEFVLFLDTVRLSEEHTMDTFLTAVSGRLNGTLTQKMEKTGKRSNISLSMGAVLFSPLELSSEELLCRADEAMYYAKLHRQETGLLWHLWSEENTYTKVDDRKGRL